MERQGDFELTLLEIEKAFLVSLSANFYSSIRHNSSGPGTATESQSAFGQLTAIVFRYLLVVFAWNLLNVAFAADLRESKHELHGNPFGDITFDDVFFAGEEAVDALLVEPK